VSTPPPSIDLNCDLGEDPSALDRDEALMRLVTSANIACGGHAGDEPTMDRIAALAAELGIAAGAHPSYPDRAGFGRGRLDMAPAAIEASIAAQLSALHAVLARRGLPLTHIKPHGALYHAAMHDPQTASAIARAAARFGRPTLVGQAGAPALGWWEQMGFAAAPEAFADRAYDPDGSLRPRSRPGALIQDPAAAAGQALKIARGEPIDAGGRPLVITARTICIHSDTPGAIDTARAVRERLTAAGIGLRPLPHGRSTAP
jgi:UPF0271 protein